LVVAWAAPGPIIAAGSLGVGNASFAGGRSLKPCAAGGSDGVASEAVTAAPPLPPWAAGIGVATPELAGKKVT
jgi:hypothetical protein